MILQALGNQRKAGIAILRQNRLQVKNYSKKQRRSLCNNKEVNIPRRYNSHKYVPNIWIPKHIEQILIDLKGEIDNNMIIIGDFSTPLWAMDRIVQTENQ